MSSITLDRGVFSGPVLAGRNGSLDESGHLRDDGRGSIHDDATASRLGFRGGTVAGSIHMDQFPPVLVRAFGQEWFERGSLSLYFINATIDLEKVQAFVEDPAGGAGPVKAWMLRDDGTPVAEGTASMGGHSRDELQTRDLRATPTEGLRILKGVEAGRSLGEHMARLDSANQRARQAGGFINEPLDWYVGDSPWGGPVASPNEVVALLYRQPAAALRVTAGPVVGLFGAIEVAHINGPVLLDKDYRVTAEVVAVGQSPKTEYFWFDSTAHDGDTEVASMRMLLRFMKASSPLYAE